MSLVKQLTIDSVKLETQSAPTRRDQRGFHLHAQLSVRVLHITASLSPALGGPSIAALQMCRALSRKGLDVSLFTTTLAERGRFLPLYKPGTVTAAEGQQLHENDFEISYFPVRWPTRYAFSPQMRLALNTKIGEIDVVHIHSVYLYTTSVAARLAKRQNVPYLIRPHGAFMPHLRHRNQLAKAVYHRTIGPSIWDSAAAIHYTSERERDQAKDIGIKAPAVVIPLGIELDQFKDLPPRGSFRVAHGIGSGPLIAFLGRLAPRKGLDLLISAFGRIAARFPDSRLVLAGPDEFGFQRTLEDSIDRLGLRERVTLPGLVTGLDKLALLSDTDMWVLPSYGENFGLAVLEALAAGCATVISDRVDIHRELSEQHACEVTACDADQLNAVLERLITSPALRSSLGVRGKQAAQLFSWDRRVEPLIELYETISRKPARVEMRT